MKLITKYLSLLLAMVMVSGLAVSCGDDDEPVEPTPPPTIVEEDVLKVGSSELLFAANASSSQSVNITCNKEWNAAADVNWIDLSPKSGEGNGSLSISVNSANATSKERSATVTVTSGDLTRSIQVVQKASLVADCTVTPTNIVTLSNQFAFDAVWGKKAAYFQFLVIEEKDAKRMTDAEIIEATKSEKRYVENDNFVYLCLTLDGEYYLSPSTEYLVCTLAHDENGEMGDLIKTPVSTRNNQNQAAALISNLVWNGSRWGYTTTINPYASEYYDIIWSGTTLDNCRINDPDIIYAYFLNEGIKNNPDVYVPAIQSGNWTITPSYSPYILIATWAKDKNGNWSGIVTNDWANSSWYSSSAKRPTVKSTPHVRPENGVRNKADYKNFSVKKRF